MSAERMPHDDDSLLARPLRWATSLVLRHPQTVVGAALLFAAAAIVISIYKLEFHTSRLDLLNPQSTYNQRWLAYLEEFGSDDDAVVVVESEDPEAIEPAIDDAAAEILRREDLFHSLMYKNDVGEVRRKGLHFLSIEELQRIQRYAEQSEPIAQGDWNRLQLQRLFTLPPAGGASGGVGANVSAFEPLADSLYQALNHSPNYVSPWPLEDFPSEQMQELNPSYLTTNEGRLGFLLVRLATTAGGFNAGSATIDELRTLLRDVNTRHPNVQIGLTGMPVLENDEMRASQADMTQASILSLVGVACLFIAGFGGLRRPLIAVATLLIALAWSFGYLTLAVGHLNLLSVSFGAILIGLGIDFGVHYIARYLQLRSESENCGEALQATAASIGPGVVTGGLTTAIAFCTAALTHFTGVAELGIIAGGGVVLCVIAALFVLPALLQLIDGSLPASATPAPLPIDRALRPLLAHPKLVILFGCLLTIFLGLGTTHLRYDHNLLNLQPTRLESVELERDILTQSDRSVWFALSIANSPEELLARKKAFEKLPCVERTEQIAELTPAPSSAKAALIAQIRDHLQALPSRPSAIELTNPTALADQLAMLRTSFPAALAGSPVMTKLAKAEQILRDRPLAETTQLLAEHQMRMAADLLERLRTLHSVADPEPPTLDDVPKALRARFVGANGRLLLRVYARGDIWDMEQLKTFVEAVESVDSHVTGHPVQSYYASRQMQESYIHAALYSLLAVAIVLMLDFRSVRSSLLALSPMVLGMVQTFGVLGFFGIPLNPANMIVLPLILGIGIDDGVHVVHDYRRQKKGYRLGGSTAVAVLITSLTTMVGFGMMIFAKHQGLRSLGQVLTIGVFFCLVNSLLVLPALLSFVAARRKGESAGRTESEAESQADSVPAPRLPEYSLETVGAADSDAAASGGIRIDGPGEVPPQRIGGAVIVRRKIIVRRRETDDPVSHS